MKCRALVIGIPTFVLALGALLGDTSRQAESQMVDLNVIAVDNHGQPVLDLTRDDFQVTDAGKLQKIVFFRHLDGRPGRPPSLAPNEFSNQGSNVFPATVILLDLLSEGLGATGYSVDQLERALSSLESADGLYLYILTAEGQLDAVQGLSDEEPAHPEGAAPWTRQAKPLLDKAWRQVYSIRPRNITPQARVQLTFQALDALATDLSRIPGRKNIVWITRGLPLFLDPRRSDTGLGLDFTDPVRRFAQSLDQAGIAIYPVRQVLLDVQDAADEFAALTGGRPDAGKDPAATIRQAMNDVRTSYQIGYYPPPKNWDGKFHKLHVASTRKGVRLQVESGYYAWPQPAGATAREAIDRVAGMQFDAAEIGLRATLDSSDGRTAQLQAHIDANDIAWTEDGSQFTGNLILALIQYPAEGKPEMSPIVPFDVHDTGQQLEEAKKEGVLYSQTVAIDAGVKRIRLIVVDWNSDIVGSVSLPIPVAGK